jgi:stage V sporulation protein B
MLSAAIAAGDREKQALMVQSSYRLTALLSLPASLGVTAFSYPILTLLFGHDPKAVALASPLLSCLGVSVFLSCMITATNSVLHAYREVNRPILSLIIGAIVKVVSGYLLIGNDQIALMGAPVSTFLCNAAVVLSNLFFASRLCRVEKMTTLFLKPLGAAALSIGVALALYLPLSNHFGVTTLLTVSCILLSCFLYLLFSCLLGVLEAEDLRAMPMGEKILDALIKLHLIQHD